MKTLISQAERARTEYNPLRGLTIARAVSLLEAGERGEYADLMWTYEFVEGTDPDLLALVERRTSAMQEMDWNVKTVSEDTRGYSHALAEDQAGVLREAYENIGNLYEAIEHLEMAAFRGFSVLQPRWDTAGVPTHLECLDQWNFVRDGRYGEWYWNPEARSVSARSLGKDHLIKPESVIIHQTKRAIDRIGLVKFVRANLSEKDWDFFIETYGIPGVFVIMPDSVPSDREAEYMAAAEAAARGNSGALPGGSKVESTKDLAGTPPFEARLRYLSEQLVLAGTGGKLTMLTAAGSGTLAGGAHSDTFEQIARADAAVISEIFQRKLDRRILAARFPDRPRLAYWDLAAEESQDIGEIINHYKALAEAGLQIDPEEVAERTGYKITGLRAPAEPAGPAPEGAPPLTVPNAEAAPALAADLQPLTPEEQLRDNTLALALHAEREELAPLASQLYAALEALDAGDTAAYTAALREIRDSLPGMAESLLVQPQLAQVLADGLAAALANGWEANTLQNATTDSHG
jgi:phage gp29-like protein